MKKILGIMLLFFVSCSALNQMAHSSIESERVDLLSKSIVVKMPNPVHFQKENYEEGVVYIYTFNDGGCIIFHEGGLMQFDVDSYKPSAIVNKKGHTIYVGKENNRCWRKDVCKGVQFYYYNVPTENKEKYDMLFDSIKIFNKK
ncbi:hypothetical protein [Segatella paludivivens]|uniref:hypothetical protein n=1 Tax=Segatella paludivivens TaxID=185294 RepID=UPI000372BA5E|nr:hypothetical protein [Segatella paludivivens]